MAEFSVGDRVVWAHIHLTQNPESVYHGVIIDAVDATYTVRWDDGLVNDRYEADDLYPENEENS